MTRISCCSRQQLPSVLQQHQSIDSHVSLLSTVHDHAIYRGRKLILGRGLARVAPSIPLPLISCFSPCVYAEYTMTSAIDMSTDKQHIDMSREAGLSDFDEEVILITSITTIAAPLWPTRPAHVSMQPSSPCAPFVSMCPFLTFVPMCLFLTLVPMRPFLTLVPMRSFLPLPLPSIFFFPSFLPAGLLLQRPVQAPLDGVGQERGPHL